MTKGRHLALLSVNMLAFSGRIYVHTFPYVAHRYLRHFGPALDFVADHHSRKVERLFDISKAHPKHVDAIAN